MSVFAMSSRSTTRRRAWLRRVFKGGLIFIFVVSLLTWLVFEHKPAWYRPVVANEGTVMKAQAETAALADRIGDSLVEGRSFEVSLKDEHVTGWLACLDQVLPGTQFFLPPELSDPAVRFEDGQIRVGLLFSHRGWRAVINATMIVELIDRGQAIRITCVNVKGGSLTAPGWLLRRLAKALRRSLLEQQHDQADRLQDDSMIERLQSVDDLLEGWIIRNEFVWPNGDRPFRIGAIHSGGGTARIMIEPL